MKENVVRLQVPMHNIVLIEHLKCLKKLLQNHHCFLFLKRVLFPQQALQCPPIAILIDKIEVILSFQHIKIGDNMFVFLDIG